MNKILAVLNTQESAKFVLESALALARVNRSSLHVYKPSYDTIYELNRYIGFDNYDELEQQVVDLDNEWLKSLIHDLNVDDVSITYSASWSQKNHEGILEQAKQQQSDLIIKAADVHHRVAEIVRTPEEWRLLRDANCPVILLRNKSIVEGATIVAAINSLEDDEPHYELHRRVLTQATQLADILKGKLIVTCAIPLIPYNVPYAIDLSMQYPQLQESLQTRAQQAMQELLSKENIKADEVVIESGSVEDVLHRVCNRSDAALLCIGTVANKGLANILLGNTSERVVHHVDQSIMVVG